MKIVNFLLNIYRLSRYHLPELLNPYYNLTVFKQIFVQVISTNFKTDQVKNIFTVVIVIRNEENTIMSLLRSISSQTLVPSNIVIIDGGSTDDTVNVIYRFLKKSKLQISFHIMPGSTISEGANFGIVNAKTELIITLHAGCVLDRNCFGNLVGPMTSSNNIDLVGGVYYSQHKNHARYLIPNWEDIDWSNFLPSSRICCFKKSIATQAGLFPTNLSVGEDTYFFVKYRSLSRFWVFNRNAYLWWDNPNTLLRYSKVLNKYATGDGLSGLGDFLYYNHYRAFEKENNDQKQIYIKGYKQGKKQRYGHLFYQEKIKGVLIIFSDKMMYENTEDHQLITEIKKYIDQKWHVIYVAPTLYENFAGGHQGVYLPLDLTKIDLTSFETYSVASLAPYLINNPLPVKIINRYSGNLWKYKIILSRIRYAGIMNQ